jgi:hypothetical protein
MLGHSIVSQHFMEPKGSIPNSQELSTCSYPEPDQSPHHHITPSHLSKIHPNIIHPPKSWSSEWALSLWLSFPVICILFLVPERLATTSGVLNVDSSVGRATC